MSGVPLTLHFFRVFFGWITHPLEWIYCTSVADLLILSLHKITKFLSAFTPEAQVEPHGFLLTKRFPLLEFDSSI